MHIQRAVIEGFGIFQQQEFAFHPGLNLICGPNEAGKSTLLAFVQQVLFGFPDGRNRQQRAYPALRGGRHGGRLLLADQDGQIWVVERYAGRHGGEVSVRREDGSQGGVPELEMLLGRASREVFCRVFAFGLSELQEIGTLNSAEVRARIYSAGTGGVPVAQFERQLGEEAEQLFKGGGHKQPINCLLADLDQRSRDLRELGDLPAEYADQLAHRDTLQAQLEQQAQQLVKREDQLREHQRLVEAWAEWRGLEAVEQALVGLPVVDDFPENGLEQRQRLQEHQADLAQEVKKLRQQIESETAKLERLVVRQALLAQEQALGALASDRNRYEVDRDALTRGKQELESAEEQLREALHTLGPEWDEERLQLFDGSIPVREEIRAFAKRFEAAEQKRHDLERAAGEAARRLSEVQHELAQAGEAIAGQDLVDEARLRGRQQAVGRLANLQGQYQALAEQQRRMEQQASVEAMPVPVEPLVLPGWPTYMLVGVGLLGGLLLAATTSLIAGGVMALLGLAGVWFYRWVSAKITVARPPASAPPISLPNWKGITGQLAILEKELKDVADRLGMEDGVSAEELGQIQTRLQAEDRALQAQTARAEHLEELEEQNARRAKEAEEARERWEEAEKTQKAARQEWTGWLVAHDLRESLSTASALEVLAETRTAREKLKSVDDLRHRITALQVAVVEYEQRVEQVCADCGLKGGSGSSLLSRVDRLTEDLEQTRQHQQQGQGIEDRLREYQRCLAEVEKERVEVESAEQELLVAVGAVDGQDFEARGKIWRQRLASQEQQQQYRQRLERLIGVGERYERALAILREKSEIELEEEAGRLEAQVVEIRAQLDQDREQLGRLKQLIEGLEKNEEAARLRLEQNTELERLEGQAREWAIWTIGRALLEEARRYYERERRPGVIKEAEGIFRQMTGTRYSQLIAPLDQEHLLVQDQTGGQRTVEQLSRGTVEQLYLSLRMGLVKEFGRKAEPLPVIVDDILVNFDPERARQAARALNDLAQDCQVIVLTCHPATKELLQDGQGSTHLIELDQERAFEKWVASPTAGPPVVATKAWGNEEKAAIELGTMAILAQGDLGIVELADCLGETRESVREVLEALRTQGRVDSTGRGRGTRWTLVDRGDLDERADE